MELATAIGLIVQLTGAAAELMAKAQAAGAIVARAQADGRAFTPEEKARLRALDDEARAVLDAAIARAAARPGD